jgi:hypothetical protein
MINDKLQLIIDNTNAGRFTRVEWERLLKVKKGVDPIIKATSATLTLGTSYDSKAIVKEKRENGDLPAENAGLPWGEWLQYPWVIAHKGEQYLRCSVVKNDRNPPKVSFFQGGVEISRDQAKAQAYASEFYDRDDLIVFNLKAESIKSISTVDLI